MAQLIFSKRLTLTQLQILDDAEAYLKQMQQDGEQLIKDSVAYCAQLENDLRDKAELNYQQEIAKLYNAIEERINGLVGELSTNLTMVIGAIAHKMGYDQFNEAHVCSLLEDELHGVIQKKSLTIHCHPSKKEFLTTSLTELNDVLIVTSSLMPLEKFIVESYGMISEIDIAEIVTTLTTVLQDVQFSV